MGGVLSVGNGFPDDLAIIGDEFLKSCEWTVFPVQRADTQGTRSMITPTTAESVSRAASTTTKLHPRDTADRSDIDEDRDATLQDMLNMPQQNNRFMLEIVHLLLPIALTLDPSPLPPIRPS